ncbi:MAG TPA: phosphotransferase [Microthrixaceae bacterium]|nr:phosphotransferase [Microthrixaceae bacterium]
MAAEVVGDSFTSLVHNRANPVTRDVQRVVLGSDSSVRGSALGEPGTSVVVKTICPDGEQIVPHWSAGADASHWNYWSREDQAYSSQLTNAFEAGGIRGPRLLDRVELSDGSVQLWLEDVPGRSGHDLALEDHVRLARRLGKAQGILGPGPEDSSAVSGGVLSKPFLSRGWMRSYALSRPPGPAIYEDHAAWEHPVVVAGFGEERHRIRAKFGELHRESERWFALLESLPRTLCHLDYWPNNAIATDGPATEDVLVDWAFVGDGAVGEDPGNWVPDTLFDHFMEPERFADLDCAVWEAYSAGLGSAGWSWPIEYARLGMCASAIKYIWLPGLMVFTADHKGPTGYGGQESYPLVEVFRRRGLVFERLLAWLDEADGLASQLGLDSE